MVDVDDVIVVVRGFVDVGFVDFEWIVICGGFVGGWMVFLVFVCGGVFVVGISCYGVVDLWMLVVEIYDFEVFYFDGLVGLFLESEDVYIEWLFFMYIDCIDVLVLFL